MPDSGQEHTTDCNNGFLVSAACLNASVTEKKFQGESST